MLIAAIGSAAKRRNSEQKKLPELAGRIGVNAYNDLQGKAKSSLTLRVNSIKCMANHNRETCLFSVQQYYSSGDSRVLGFSAPKPRTDYT